MNWSSSFLPFDVIFLFSHHLPLPIVGTKCPSATFIAHTRTHSCALLMIGCHNGNSKIPQFYILSSTKNVPCSVDCRERILLEIKLFSTGTQFKMTKGDHSPDGSSPFFLLASDFAQSNAQKQFAALLHPESCYVIEWKEKYTQEKWRSEWRCKKNWRKSGNQRKNYKRFRSTSHSICPPSLSVVAYCTLRSFARLPLNIYFRLQFNAAVNTKTCSFTLNALSPKEWKPMTEKTSLQHSCLKTSRQRQNHEMKKFFVLRCIITLIKFAQHNKKSRARKWQTNQISAALA